MIYVSQQHGTLPVAGCSFLMMSTENLISLQSPQASVGTRYQVQQCICTIHRIFHVILQQIFCSTFLEICLLSLRQAIQLSRMFFVILKRRKKEDGNRATRLLQQYPNPKIHSFFTLFFLYFNSLPASCTVIRNQIKDSARKRPVDVHSAYMLVAVCIFLEEPEAGWLSVLTRVLVVCLDDD